MKTTQQLFRQKQPHSGNLQVIKSSLRSSVFTNKFICTNADGVHFINQANILYCKSEGNYSMVYLNDGTSILFSKTLKWVESKLKPDMFMRTHNSYLINLSYLSLYSKSESTILLNRDLEIPISRSRKSEIEDMILCTC